MANSKWERDFHDYSGLPGRNKIVPEIFNNEELLDGNPGLQKAIREIFHSLHYNRILHDEGTGDLAPSGVYTNVSTASGYIMVVNDDGLSEIKYVAPTTGNTLAGGTENILVCTKDGTITVRTNRASCLDTDIPIAGRRPADNALVNFRNMEKGDRKIYKAFDAIDVTQGITIGGELRTPRIYNAFGTSVIFDDNINMGEHAISNVTELYATTYYSNDNDDDFIAAAGSDDDVLLRTNQAMRIQTIAQADEFVFDTVTDAIWQTTDSGKLGKSGDDWVELWIQSIRRTAGNIAFQNGIEMNGNDIDLQNGVLKSGGGDIDLGDNLDMNGHTIINTLGAVNLNDDVDINGTLDMATNDINMNGNAGSGGGIIRMDNGSITDASQVNTANLRSQDGAGTGIIMGSEMNMNGYDLQMNEVVTGGGDILMAGGSIEYLTKINGNVYFCNTESELTAAITAIGSGTGIIILHGEMNISTQITINNAYARITMMGGTEGCRITSSNATPFHIQSCGSFCLRDVAIISSNSTNTTAGILHIGNTARNILIHNVTVQCIAASSTRTGIWSQINVHTRLVIRDCYIFGVQHGINVDQPPPSTGTPSLISGNKISLAPSSTGSSVGIGCAPFSRVEGNRITCSTSVAAEIYGISTDEQSTMIGNDIRIIYSGSSNGIVGILGGSTDICISSNRIHIESGGTQGIGISVVNDTATVVGNFIYVSSPSISSVSSGGILIKSKYNVVSSNNIEVSSGHGAIGIWIFDGGDDYNTISNNTIHNISGGDAVYGIRCNSNFCTITGNNIRAISTTANGLYGIAADTNNNINGNSLIDLDGGTVNTYGIYSLGISAITGNSVFGITGGTEYGIYVSGNWATITGNMLYIATGTNAIYSGQYTTAVGNIADAITVGTNSEPENGSGSSESPGVTDVNVIH